MKNQVFRIVCFFILSLQAHARSDLIENIDAYHNNSKWQKLSAQETFESFYNANNLQGKEKLLDICSGDGFVSFSLAQKLEQGSVMGIDISANMVLFAQEHYGSKNISFKQIDAQKLPFQSEFDIITSFTCMQLVPDMVATYRGIEQSLKPGGKILMQFPFDHSLRKTLEKVSNSKRWKPYFRNFNSNWYLRGPKEHYAMIKKAHLKLVRLESTKKHEIYISRGEFHASISHWLPHVKYLAEPVRAEFVDDLVKTYLKEMPEDEQGYVHYFVDRVEIEAYKPHALSANLLL